MDSATSYVDYIVKKGERVMNDIENIITDEIKEGKYYSEYYITGTYYLLNKLKVVD